MSVFDIIIAVVIIWAAVSALKNVVRALLVVLLCCLLLSLACAAVVHFAPQYAEGSGQLFSLFAKAGGYILRYFVN